MAVINQTLREHGYADKLLPSSKERCAAGESATAADGHSTIFDMLGGKFTHERIRRYYDAAPRHMEMALQVAFGLNRDMPREPQALTWFLPGPVTIVDRELDRIDIEVYSFDDTLAPKGKTVVKVMLSAGYDYWRGLQAWGVPGEPFAMFKGLTRTLPGLRNMYMVGQWAESTIGLPTAMVSGRRAVQSICRLDRKRFRATVD